MPSIVVRGLDDSVKAWLGAQAQQHGRSYLLTATTFPSEL